MQIYQGEPISAWFNSESASFVTEYNVDLNIKSSSRLFYSQEYHYTNGLVISLSFLPNTPITSEIQKITDNYYDINCVKKSSTSDLQLDNGTDIYSGTLYVTKPFDGNQIKNLNDNYLKKLNISLKLDSTADDITMTRLNVNQSGSNPNMYLEVLGIKSVNQNQEMISLCKVSFQSKDNSYCLVSSHKLARNKIRIYKTVKELLWSKDELIFENTLESLHGQVLSFDYRNQ